MEQLVTIELFGQTFTFKAESDIYRAKEVSDLLLKEVAKVEKQHSGQPSNISKYAILISAALNIANENIELEKNKSALLQEISKRSAHLLRVLDATS